MSKPLIALTMGDPAGVGPEIIIAALGNPAIHEMCRPILVGHPEIFRRAAKLLGSTAPINTASINAVSIAAVDSPEAATGWPETIPCLQVCSDEALDAPPGQIDVRGGEAAYQSLVAAARLALERRIDALVTAPLHKGALWKAGHHYPGHTELLAELCGVDQYAMMLYLAPGETVRGPLGLSIVHVTLHTALRDVVPALSCEAILEKARLVDEVIRRLHGSAPRIGICALNPHAGEQGLFGDEEGRIIAPAVERGRAQGLDLTGPLPADTLIARARDGQFDAVVAMYHDQGHIAIKLLAMHRAVNVTLGLPIVRTSVAHGTAFDLAWQGRAESAGMIEAIRAASRLAAN